MCKGLLREDLFLKPQPLIRVMEVLKFHHNWLRFEDSCPTGHSEAHHIMLCCSVTKSFKSLCCISTPSLLATSNQTFPWSHLYHLCREYFQVNCSDYTHCSKPGCCCQQHQRSILSLWEQCCPQQRL